MIDFTTEFGQRVAQQLKAEQIIWLTTIGPENSPQPRPVWFLWDGTSVLIYSQANAHKLGHMTQNSKVSLNFNTDVNGEEVSVLLGEAQLDPNTPPANANAAYVEKYEKGIASLEMTPQGFAEEYPIALKVTPTRLRGF